MPSANIAYFGLFSCSKPPILEVKLLARVQFCNFLLGFLGTFASAAMLVRDHISLQSDIAKPAKVDSIDLN